MQLPNNEFIKIIEDGEGYKYLVYWKPTDSKTWK